MADPSYRPSRRRKGGARSSHLIPLLVITTILASALSAMGDTSAASSRIIVISDETTIPIAVGTPGTGLSPFEGVLANRVGVHITGQVVDGDYTPIWQPGATYNNGIGHTLVHWAFGDEADRAHSATTDGDGLFSFYLTPDVGSPYTTQLRFWFDGKADSVYGIPIYPAAEVVYEITIAEEVSLTVEPLQSRAMAGDTIIVQGGLKGRDGGPISGEGLMTYFDGLPAQGNPYPGWYIDLVQVGDDLLGYEEWAFQDGSLGPFTTGGTGSQWSAGLPKAGPSGPQCAGTALDGDYDYGTDSWLMGPTVDLRGYDEATLVFNSWARIAPGDLMAVEMSNDGGMTWPVEVTVDATASWSTVEVPVGEYLDTPYGTVQLADTDAFMFRFRLVSNNLPVVTDQDGRFEFLYTIPEDRAAGPATIMVHHPASGGYAGTTATATIDVARWTAIEVIGPDEMYRGRPVEIRARLTDTVGALLATSFPGGTTAAPTVKVRLNQGGTETLIGERAVDADGYVALGHEPPRDNPLGPATLTFSFRGNEFYASTEVTHDIVFRAHTDIEMLSPTDASLLSADSMEISGNLHIVRTESVNDVTRDPVAKRDVTIYLNDEDVGSATTDDDGTFALDFNSKAAGVNLGNAVIRAVFPGDLVLEPSEATVDFSILSPTTIQLTPRAIRKGATAVIDGTLTSIEGGLQGIVEIDLDGATHAKVVAGPTGRFAVTFEVPWDMETGPAEVTASYGGSSVYRPTTETVEYTVVADTRMTVTSAGLAAHRGESVAVRGTLTETCDGTDGPPVTGAIVEMTLADGSRAQAMTALNGNFTYYYPVPSHLPVGDYAITISYDGAHRSPSTASVPLVVASPTTLSFALADSRAVTDNPVLVEVSLRDDMGGPVEGKGVEVLVVIGGEGTTIFDGVTDQAGNIVFKSSFNTTGTLTLVARFEGDAHHLASEGYDYIHVKAAAVEAPPLHKQPTVVIGGGLSIVLLLAMFLTESGKYLVLKLLLVPMYTKLKKTDVLDHFVRGQIYGLIRMNPGAHYNLIKKKLDLKNGVLAYHLTTLEREGYIISEMDGVYKRFYPNHVKFEADFPIFISKLQERILDLIRKVPGVSQKDVAKELGVSTSTVNDNIRVLKQNKLVELRRDGKRTLCFAVEG